MEDIKKEVLKEDIKEILKSICITDEDVQMVVNNIRTDIISMFRDKIKMVGEKILVRKILIRESEKTRGGVLITEGKDKNIKPESFYSTHPFQGVVIALNETSEVKIGDHVLCKSEIEIERLDRGGVVINGYIFGFIHFTDIICIRSGMELDKNGIKCDDFPF